MKSSVNCKAWKAKDSVWHILQTGKVNTYLENLKGFKAHVTKAFFINWIKDRVSLHGVTMHLTEEFIVEVMGLPKEGIKFSKKMNISNVAFKKFPKMDEEEKNMEKNGNFYELGQLKLV